MSAFVEVVFDNSDGRMPNGSKEFVLRRTLGQQKDEYSIDRKNASRQEVNGMLESAGFSRSNPYYIVPQGRITSITNGRDVDRLQILEMVAGTSVYDEKRSESHSILKNTEQDRRKIEDTLQVIDERLHELEEEKKDLRKYQEKDRQKRVLDYTLYDRERKQLLNTSDNYRADHGDNLAEMEQSVAEYEGIEEKAAELETAMGVLQENVKLLSLEKEDFDKDLAELLTRNARAELKVADLLQNKDQASQLLKDRLKEEKALTAEIAHKERQLNETKPRYEKLEQEETVVRNEVKSLGSRQQHLQLKRGQHTRFTSKSQRDQWLEGEVANLQRAIGNRSAAKDDLVSDISDVENQHKTMTDKISDARQQLEEASSQHLNTKRKLAEAETRRQQLVDDRKMLWREDSKNEVALSSARERETRQDRTLSETMSRDMSIGMKAVEQIKRDLQLEGVYGTLSDLIEVDDKYKLALETTAGASLFHILVDTERTATQVLKELTRRNAGRATFMPLDKLEPPHVEYPTDPDTADKVIPLIQKIRYDPLFEVAVKQVFARTLVCMSLEVGQQFASKGNMNAITLEGDRVDNRGVLTGGYHDSRRSRMDAVRLLRAAREEASTLEAQSLQIKNSVTIKDQEINKSINEIHQLSNANSQAIAKVKTLEEELRSLIAHEEQLKDVLDGKKRSLASLMADLNDMNDRLESYKSDLTSPFQSNLSEAELQDLTDIANRLPNLKRRLQVISTDRMGLEESRAVLQTDLQRNLYIRRDQLKSRSIETEDTDETALHEAQQVVDHLKLRINTGRTKIDEVNAEMKQQIDNLAGKEQQLNDAHDKLNTLQSKIERKQRALQKKLADLARLEARKDEVDSRIRELGVLPGEAFNEYMDTESEELLKLSHEVAEELKKYSHINKNAAEHFKKFADDREALVQRNDEIVSSHESIRTLIKTLDNSKDEAINRTFKQVSKNFHDIFQRLVPNGRGELLMQRKSPEAIASQLQANETYSAYAGVGIQVSFNSKHNEQQRIEQLSGGQKSLCALTFIFAIQQCDPAPFYLFDEIDANLDTQYRTAVASMIHELSQSGQFICTTFRPEMLHVADNFLGVLFENKKSKVEPISRDDAMGFVQGAATT
jgi:structural maintenance of chromosome 3 (chondroitin sulfate proteoglycan 6)